MTASTFFDGLLLLAIIFLVTRSMWLIYRCFPKRNLSSTEEEYNNIVKRKAALFMLLIIIIFSNYHLLAAIYLGYTPLIPGRFRLYNPNIIINYQDHRESFIIHIALYAIFLLSALYLYIVIKRTKSNK